MSTLLLRFVTALCLSISCGRALAQQEEATAPADKPADVSTSATTKTPTLLPADPEERFKALLTKASLAGRWAPLKDGELGEEKNGDKYGIVSVVKREGENWIVNAKLKYRDQELVLPIPVQVKFAGDTAILVVDKLAIPGGGTYSARLMFYQRTYSGTWSGGRLGGMLYGTITNEKE